MGIERLRQMSEAPWLVIGCDMEVLSEGSKSSALASHLFMKIVLYIRMVVVGVFQTYPFRIKAQSA